MVCVNTGCRTKNVKAAAFRHSNEKDSTLPYSTLPSAADGVEILFATADDLEFLVGAC